MDKLEEPLSSTEALVWPVLVICDVLDANVEVLLGRLVTDVVLEHSSRGGISTPHAALARFLMLDIVDGSQALYTQQAINNMALWELQMQDGPWHDGGMRGIIQSFYRSHFC